MMMLRDDTIIHDLPFPSRGANFLWLLGIRTAGEARAVLLYADAKLFALTPNFGKTTLQQMRAILWIDGNEEEWSAEQQHRGEICAFSLFNTPTMKAIERRWIEGMKIQALAGALHTHSTSVIAGLRRGGWINPEIGHDSSGRKTEAAWTYTCSKNDWRKPFMEDRRGQLKFALA